MHYCFQMIKQTKNQQKTNEKPTKNNKNQQISKIVLYLRNQYPLVSMICIVERGTILLSYLHTYTVNTSHNTQPQHTAQLPKNTDTMISPARHLPADPILQVSAIVVRHAINLDHRNMAMHFFNVKFPVKKCTDIGLFWLFDCHCCRHCRLRLRLRLRRCHRRCCHRHPLSPLLFLSLSLLLSPSPLPLPSLSPS